MNIDCIRYQGKNVSPYGMALTITAVAVLVLCGVMRVSAQTGAITADPNAKALRQIWRVTGTPFVGGERVGEGVVGLGDIYGTGKGAWGVFYGRAQQSRIFRHDSDDIAKDTVPVQVFDSLFIRVVGDFWGTGHRAIGFQAANVDTTGGRTKYYFEMRVYRTEQNRIADVPAMVLNTRLMTPPRQVTIPNALLVADLDGDGISELILVHGGVGYDTGVSRYPELWIYKGGPNFQLDSPTVIVKHPILNGQIGVNAQAGDFDGDGHMDIAMSRSYTDTRNHLTFYWGTGDLSTFGRPEDTRIIPLTDSMPDARWRITALDCDGDGVTDLAMDRGRGQPTRQGVYLFRNTGGRNARTRSFTMSDADQWFPAYTTHCHGGYLNDRSRRYAMLTLIQFGFDVADPSTVYLFSGGKNGPDLAYDAHVTSSDIRSCEPVFDVDGDGWDDFLAANPAVDHNGGVAVIFAGGPYIPRDSSISGVHDVAVAGIHNAISSWPNPATNDLHIAWRGDLKRMPSNFAVHDLLGRLVAEGNVEQWRGAALWHCADVPAGTYLLSISDADGALIATTRVIKR